MNPFIGATQAQLESWLRDAQRDLAAGKTISAVNAGDAGSQKMVQMTPLDRITKLLAALSLIDPTTYPPADIRKVTRTKTFVSWNENGAFQ